MATKAQERARRNFKKATGIAKKAGLKPFTKTFGARVKKELAKMNKGKKR